jgi:hypothetical protein
MEQADTFRETKRKKYFIPILLNILFIRVSLLSSLEIDGEPPLVIPLTSDVYIQSRNDYSGALYQVYQ